MFSLTTFLSTLFFLVFVAQASPLTVVARAALDVFVPTITQPEKGTTWFIGQQATVSWDTSDAPASISNAAYIVLHEYGVIAKDFDLRAGSVSFLVPPGVPQGPTFITLFGDSGNYSPVFTIEEAAHSL